MKIQLYGTPLWIRIGVWLSKCVLLFQLNKTHRILIIKFGSLGDALLYSGAMKSLRKQFPESHITFAASSRALPLLKRFREIDRLLVLDEEATGLSGLNARWSRIWFASRLLGSRYDMTVAPWYLTKMDNHGSYGLSNTGEMMNLWRSIKTEKIIALCIPDQGLIGEVCNYIPVNASTVCVAKASDDEHELEKVRSLFKAAGCQDEGSGSSVADMNPYVELTEHEKNYAASEKAKVYSRCSLLVSLCPGARFSCKQWGADKYATLLDMMAAEGEECISVWLLGSEEDIRIAEEIESRVTNSSINIINKCGQASLYESISLIKESDICIGNDTFGLHAAIAVGTPSVVIMWSGDGDRWIPWGEIEKHRMVRSAVQCEGCEGVCVRTQHTCMDAVAPEEVIREIVALDMTASDRITGR